MTFLIKRETYNGYRCCRYRSDDSEDVVETLEEAMANFPSFPIENDWGGLEKIEVIDQETEELIAYGSVQWPRGYYRGCGYEYTKWSGFTHSGEFDRIISGRNFSDEADIELITDRTWAQILSDMEEKENKKRLEMAQQELAAAQKKVEFLSKEK